MQPSPKQLRHLRRRSKTAVQNGPGISDTVAIPASEDYRLLFAEHGQKMLLAQNAFQSIQFQISLHFRASFSNTQQERLCLQVNSGRVGHPRTLTLMVLWTASIRPRVADPTSKSWPQLFLLRWESPKSWPCPNATGRSAGQRLALDSSKMLSGLPLKLSQKRS